MWNPCWSTIALLSVAILSAGQLQSPLDPGTSPLLYWSSDLGSAAVPRSSRVVYEELPGAPTLARLLEEALGIRTAGPAPLSAGLQKPELIFLVAGAQLSAAQLADGGVEELQKLQEQGRASVSFPYVRYQTHDMGVILEAAYDEQHLDTTMHKHSSCQQSSQGPHYEFPAAVLGQSQVVLICGHDMGSADSMKLLSKVATQAHSSGRSHAFLYAASPQNQVSQYPHAHARTLLVAEHSRLLSTYPEGDICNKKCRSQVQILQNWILAVTLLSSLTIGMCFLHLVGTPTRFETPKEAYRQE